MRQENYLKTEPAKLRNQSGPEKTLQHLRLMDKAASSISDSDLVDALIHGYVCIIVVVLNIKNKHCLGLNNTGH